MRTLILLCLISIQCAGQDSLRMVSSADSNGRMDMWVKAPPIRPNIIPEYTIDTVILDSAKWPNKIGHIIHEIRYVDPRSLVKDTSKPNPIGLLSLGGGTAGYISEGTSSWGMSVGGTNVHLHKRKHHKGKVHRIYHKPTKLKLSRYQADTYAEYIPWFYGTGEVISRDGRYITIRYTAGKFFNKKSKI